jgi:hypothetical protein
MDQSPKKTTLIPSSLISLLPVNTLKAAVVVVHSESLTTDRVPVVLPVAFPDKPTAA